MHLEKHMHPEAQVWRSEASARNPGPSPHHVGSRHSTVAIRLDGRQLYLLSNLSGPQAQFLNV